MSAPDNEVPTITTSWLSIIIQPCRSKTPPRPPPLPADASEPIPPPPLRKASPGCCVMDDDYRSRTPAEFQRRSGFQRPFNLYQIVSWIVFGIVVSGYFLIVIPSMSKISAIIFGVLFGIISTVVVSVAVRVTQIDPMDPNTSTQEPDHERGGSGMAYCDLCGPIEQGSRHCRACNKCVSGFDHHCKWLNNCIGKKNYPLFLVLVCSVFVLNITAIAGAIQVIIEQAVTGMPGVRWMERYGGFNEPLFYIVVVGVSFISNIPCCVLDGQLLVLHAYLLRRNMTTFEYITHQVALPVEEESDDNRCCVDWIIIDKKRLERAKKKRAAVPDQIEGSPIAVIGDENPSYRDSMSDDIPAGVVETEMAHGSVPLHTPSSFNGIGSRSIMRALTDQDDASDISSYFEGPPPISMTNLQVAFSGRSLHFKCERDSDSVVNENDDECVVAG
eukprot:GHVO01011641.1.p1 GENE.GHVO01011641.1~~GHVO01011641.1.p1  ORF type:complete len:444 (-),score=41.09 GHVO01011641.1:313-1644(-)